MAVRRDSIAPLGLIQGLELRSATTASTRLGDLVRGDRSFLARVLAAGLPQLTAGNAKEALAKATAAMEEFRLAEDIKLHAKLGHVWLVRSRPRSSACWDNLRPDRGLRRDCPQGNHSAARRPGRRHRHALVATAVGLWIAVVAVAFHQISCQDGPPSGGGGHTGRAVRGAVCCGERKGQKGEPRIARIARMQFTNPTAPNRLTVLPILGAALVPAVLVLRWSYFAEPRGGDGSAAVRRRRPVCIARFARCFRASLREGAAAIAGQPVAAGGEAAAWQREEAAVRLLGFGPSQVAVVIHADPDTPTSAVRQLVDAAHQAGFQQSVLAEGRTR